MELSKQQLSVAGALLLSGGGIGALIEYVATQKTMQVAIAECTRENVEQQVHIDKLKEKVMEHDILLGVHHP